MVEALNEHAFEHLFVECLGWDRLWAAAEITRNGITLHPSAVAQKYGIEVFHCRVDAKQLADRHLLRHVQRQLRCMHQEHIMIYSCKRPRRQVWQWAVTHADGRRILLSEPPFSSANPPKQLIERIERLDVTFPQETQTGAPDVLLQRVHGALMPDGQGYVRQPAYSARSENREVHQRFAGSRARKNHELEIAVKRGEPGALQALVEYHMPLARKSSRRLIRWFGMDPDDAEQTAMIGLLEAARRFDPERGYQFSTYAGYWIRSCCRRYGLEWGLPIHIPENLFWRCYRMLFVEAELLAAYGEQDAKPFFERELRHAGLTTDQWMLFCRARRVDYLSEIDKESRSQVTAAVGPDPPLGDMAAAEQHRCVQKALALLKPRQAGILRLRYGLEGREHSLQEVGNLLGITRERVRQIQAAAEQRMKKLLVRVGYVHT